MNGSKGKVALSADGNTFLHCPEGSSTTYRSTNNGSSWGKTNLSISDAVPVADMVNSTKFYAYNNSTGVMMVSTSGGSSFSNGGSPGSGGSKVIRTVPGKEGHIWVAMNGGGLKRSINSGSTFTAVGLGKAATGSAYHTIYIWGTVGGVTGVFRSTNEGASWTRINDDAHEYGGIGNGQFVIGDMNVYGRVYISTVGRGIAYGESGTFRIGLLASNDPVDILSASADAYPNPFAEEINVTFNTSSAADLTLKIVDMEGRVIFEGSNYQTNEKISLKDELSAANQGLYMIIGTYNGEMQAVKVEKR
jgi:hypothetical protein